ncbi:MAG: DoxX family protein [Rikenellaceae bacterium]|nr:DoxX family protein [Rikenellaceae bacterium]MDE7356135.1 DoxX family protein [Rikenellaceae bacterium]
MIKLNTNIDLGLLVLRLGVGGMMLIHGLSKIIGGIGAVKYLVEAAGMPSFLAYGVYVGEVIAPLMIVFGWRTRLGALLLAVNCIVAAVMYHPGGYLSLGATGGWSLELVGLYFLCALVLVVTGGGRYAINRRTVLD